MSINKLPGFLLHQIFFWIVTLTLLIGYKETMRDSFNIELKDWYTQLPSYGIFALYVLIFNFISSFKVYRNTFEIPSKISPEILKSIRSIKFVNIKKRFFNLMKLKEKSGSIFKATNLISLKNILITIGAILIYFISIFLNMIEKENLLSINMNNTIIFFHVLILVIFHILMFKILRKSLLIISTLLSITIIIQNTEFHSNTFLETCYHGLFLSILHYPWILILVYLVINIKNFALSEYNTAKNKKIASENYSILIEYLSFIKSESKITEEKKELLNYHLSSYNYSFKNKNSLKNFLVLYYEDFNELKFERNIKNFLLPISIMKNSRANEIKRRNKQNLLTSIFTIIFLVFTSSIISLLFKLSIINFNYLQNFLDIILVLLFTRLIVRSIEICISFYNDLHDSIDTKKSSLNKKQRAGLALNSLVEIVLLSTVIVFCLFFIKNLCNDHFILNSTSNYIGFEFLFDLVYKFIHYILLSSLTLVEAFMYTISVSFFNVSFTNFASVSSSDFLLKCVHIIQVLSSLILLTICLSSYINSTQEVKNFQLIKKNNLYYLIEISGYTNISREINFYGFKSIKGLKDSILQKYKSNSISTSDFNLYMKVIDSYLFD